MRMMRRTEWSAKAVDKSVKSNNDRGTSCHHLPGDADHDDDRGEDYDQNDQNDG